MQSELYRTFLTGQNLNDLLSKSKVLHLNGHHIVDVNAKVIGVGQGFISRLLRVNLRWSDQLADLPKSVIIKITEGSTALKELSENMPQEKREKMQNDMRLAHNAECEVYGLKGLDQMVPMAKCYAKIHCVNDQPGIIVLEDLVDRGLAYPDRLSNLSPTQMDHLIRSLANVHAWSVNNTEWHKVIPTLNEVNFMGALTDLSIATFPKSRSAYPELFQNLDQSKFDAYINKERQLELFAGVPKSRFNLPLVLVHGDVHVLNMMFERKTADQIGDELIALLDWQVSHQGCGIEDLTYLLLFCCSTTMRRENTGQYLMQYVEIFNTVIHDEDHKITYEDVKRAYDEMFSFCSIMFAAGLSLWESLVDVQYENEDDKKNARNKAFHFHHDRYEEGCKILNL